MESSSGRRDTAEAMSQENMETVRRSWEAWGNGDLDRLFALWDPEIVWDLTHFSEWPESRYDGHDGMKRFLTEWLEVWEDYEVGLDEIHLAPDGRIVSLAWQRGKGKQSGLEMKMEWAQIITVRDGKVTRIDNYDDQSAALAAAGLSE
jgi:ketosteroid isomerase-like protein